MYVCPGSEVVASKRYKDLSTILGTSKAPRGRSGCKKTGVYCADTLERFRSRKAEPRCVPRGRKAKCSDCYEDTKSAAQWIIDKAR
jgi:hypothetical protein